MDSSLSYVELLPKLRRVFWNLLHAYSLSRASQKQLVFPGVKLSWTWPLAMGMSFRDPDCGFSPQILSMNGLGEWGCGRIFGLSTHIRFLPLSLGEFPSIPVITPPMPISALWGLAHWQRPTSLSDTPTLPTSCFLPPTSEDFALCDFAVWMVIFAKISSTLVLVIPWVGLWSSIYYTWFPSTLCEKQTQPWLQTAHSFSLESS